ncbi:arylamine N-acetyltransferase [Streptomyces sp. NPDC101118]|uniref:arylamine N-acetyltransferase family protein n=1 Tax=Streptomyces sp. NPDC101118 TaxID=3366109 RepID=UPI0038119521
MTAAPLSPPAPFTAPAPSWDGRRLDLDAYLRRIGYDGDLAPTLAVLRALSRAHVTSVPFETVDIALGRTVSLDLADLQDKLVHRRRGGYCYEHALLFAAALERIGFGVTGLCSRVRTGAAGVRPATHALLRVETAETADTGRAWICDPGFGRSPLEPLELADGATSTDGWGFRLRRESTGLGRGVYALRARGPEGWFDLHAFTTDERHPSDWLVASHFMSTHRRSPFAVRLVAQRMAPDRHLFLDSTVLTTVMPDGTATERRFAPAEVPDLLEEVFGLELSYPDRAQLVSRATIALPGEAPYRDRLPAPPAALPRT